MPGSVRPRRSLSNVIQTVRTKLRRSEQSVDALEDSSSPQTQEPCVNDEVFKAPEAANQEESEPDCAAGPPREPIPLPSLDLLHDFSSISNQQWSSTFQIGLDNAANTISRDFSATDNAAPGPKSTADALRPIAARLKDNAARRLSQRSNPRKNMAPLWEEQPLTAVEVPKQSSSEEHKRETSRVPTPWIEKILETSLTQRNPSEVAAPTTEAQLSVHHNASVDSSSSQISNPEVKAYYVERLRQMCLEAGIDPSCLPLDSIRFSKRHKHDKASTESSNRASTTSSEGKSSSFGPFQDPMSNASTASSVSSLVLPPAIHKEPAGDEERQPSLPIKSSNEVHFRDENRH